MQHTVRTCTLLAAADILGGFVELRHYLRVPSAELARWLSGKDPVPMAVFLQVVDLVTDGVTRGTNGAGAREPGTTLDSGGSVSIKSPASIRSRTVPA